MIGSWSRREAPVDADVLMGTLLGGMVDPVASVRDLLDPQHLGQRFQGHGHLLIVGYVDPCGRDPPSIIWDAIRRAGP